MTTATTPVSDIISTRELLDTISTLSESHLRSLIRRRFIKPQHRGGFYFWTPDDVAKLKAYLEQRLESKQEWKA